MVIEVKINKFATPETCSEDSVVIKVPVPTFIDTIPTSATEDAAKLLATDYWEERKDTLDHTCWIYIVTSFEVALRKFDLSMHLKLHPGEAEKALGVFRNLLDTNIWFLIRDEDYSGCQTPQDIVDKLVESHVFFPEEIAGAYYDLQQKRPKELPDILEHVSDSVAFRGLFSFWEDLRDELEDYTHLLNRFTYNEWFSKVVTRWFEVRRPLTRLERENALCEALALDQAMRDEDVNHSCPEVDHPR